MKQRLEREKKEIEESKREMIEYKSSKLLDKLSNEKGTEIDEK